eukprot:c14378_g1_i1 orf=97-402(+)
MGKCSAGNTILEYQCRGLLSTVNCFGFGHGTWYQWRWQQVDLHPLGPQTQQLHLGQALYSLGTQTQRLNLGLAIDPDAEVIKCAFRWYEMPNSKMCLLPLP